ncbi:MAG TPA: hypothetical protein IGS53_24760 [Leptolyngbyaceae cyanobacterium M33_DOE_097]|uniref:Uncharacterized protein n=1 Tax=Oscillatoriales cyanobacterium SpSt-418 TaxID=2282169 RepID=A0A7C3PFF5_9CYAN|nr:hypothetical protein [Leptolyngbyaceae cyanobacterium M33_DOE_097]
MKLAKLATYLLSIATFSSFASPALSEEWKFFFRDETGTVTLIDEESVSVQSDFVFLRFLTVFSETSEDKVEASMNDVEISCIKNEYYITRLTVLDQAGNSATVKPGVTEPDSYEENSIIERLSRSYCPNKR